jgi:septum formation inhibitor-activating ATPase MinD
MSEISKVNLKNLIQIDKVEDLLSTLINQVEKQEKEILRLTKICESFVTQSNYSETSIHFENELDRIRKKLELVEDAATSKLDSSLS